MATDIIKEEFITIVPVGEGRPVTRDPAFVTVLTVGAASGAAEIVVRRPRGARLGLGLKFEGGSAAAEKVRRLLVQSCAEDSPAAKAVSPWGKLIPGDEILAIDGVSVSELTRIDCVRRLKDSDENLMLLVRHFETEDIDEKDGEVTDLVPSPKQIELLRPSLPPPVPPRKLGKKNSFKDKSCLQSLVEQNITVNPDKEGKITIQQALLTSNFNNKLSRKSSFDSHILRQSKESIACLKKGSPEEVRRLVRRLSDGKTMPPEADVYIDLLSNEWERCLALADAESDDTGSSISTVVDRLSSMASSVENSIPSTPIMQPKTIDIKKVLNCIENIDSDILKDIASSNYLENSINIKNDAKLLEKITYTNGNSISQIDNQHHNERSLNCEVNGKLYNDKNNNTTTTQSITLINLMNESSVLNKIPDVKIETHPEKPAPTPMPRNVKSETSISDKENKISSETLETNSSDILLTPTKKNCIESWLMRSEAEMCVKNQEDILEDATVPEALPRLIDFVPKPQFKESVSDVGLTRPTTAPPPPPETREDGSGASLDTIGELDETADSSLIEKSITTTDKKKEEKSICEPSFWNDRVNKSDPEDKSLSNDESPLPSCPRQPPDGVETPSDVVEKMPDTSVSRLPPRFPQGWPTTRSRLSYSRSQDARSEASVKDKIAMFSHDRATSSDRLDKCGTLPIKNTQAAPKISSSYMDSYNEVTSLDRRLTKSQDNLDDVPRSYKRHSERPEALGGLEHTKTLLNTNSLSRKSKETILHETKPIFYGSTNTLPSSNINSTCNQQVYHARSNSDDSTKGSHKLEYLIEQRKKSTSKLRALMIPETQAPIIDLPEIKVENRLPTVFALEVNGKSTTQSKSNQPKKALPNCLNLKDSWKTSTLPNNIPKYSPAFKRKSLQIYPTAPLLKEISPEPKLNEDINYSSGLKSGNKLTPLKPPRQSLDMKHSSDKSTCYSALPLKGMPVNSTKMYKEYKNIADVRDYNNMEIKICTITDVVDSDNDSAMSSTQSSYRSSASSPLHNLDSIESDSSHLSPKITHFSSYSAGKSPPPMKSLISKNALEYEKRNVCRSVSSDTNVSLSSSAGSAATSGSQASCSSLESSITDSDKKRVSKAYDIDTINRKNILASAKCRSGRDAKLNSPVIETKFSHDNYDRNTGSLTNVPERLSTLTSTVSAISSKGENRRRNKIIAASDSDTDNEINIRQRKAEFKNARLKRNLSSNSKCKQNDSICTDALKNNEDAPKAISERIIKEIKKAGLDNYPTITKPVLQNDVTENKMLINVTSSSKHEDVTMNGKSVSTSLVNNRRVTDKKSFENGTHKPNNITTDKNKEENNKYIIQTVKLKKGAGAGVGLILAGGIDCEAKNVTVHRVLTDSVAQRAGLKRGARVRSINGCAMTGLTHAESVAILKEQRTEIIVIEIENGKENDEVQTTCGSNNESKVRLTPASVVVDTPSAKEARKSGDLVTVVLEKAGKAGGTGLGFSIEGGRDSLEGGPLIIKKLFQG